MAIMSSVWNYQDSCLIHSLIFVQNTLRAHIESLSLFSGSVSSTTSLTNTGTNLTPNNNNLGTATLNVVPSTATSSSGQFGVDSGLTTANTNVGCDGAVVTPPRCGLNWQVST